MENTNQDTNATVDYLRFQVKDLEAKLKQANEIIAILQNNTNQPANTNTDFNKEQKERPSAKMIKHLSWLGKVVYVLQRDSRPMSASELYDEVDDLDGELGFKKNPKVLLSVVLHKAVKEKRLTLHKVRGSRGAYYALKEWTEENGQLKSIWMEKLY